MRALMRSLAPDAFEDVAALVALYRPGPMAANMHNDYADRKNGRKPVAYLHHDAEELLADTYGLMIYQESVMRVAQKFAGYSLAEADNLRKACGKKIRVLIAKEREKFVAGCDAHRLRRGARAPVLRHHRAVRRLRVQQEPLLRLRLHRLPDRLPQGALPGRVPRGPAHQRQGHPREGRGLPRRVPGDGHPGRGARRQPSLSDFRPLPVGRPARRIRSARSSSASRRCATSARGSSSSSSPSATPTGRSRLLRLLRPGRHVGAQQAHHRVAHQGRRLRLARPPPQGPAQRLRADHRQDRRPPEASTTWASCRSSARPRRAASFDERAPIPDLEFDKMPRLRVREGDARPLRLRPPADGRRSGAAAQDRLHAGRAAEAEDGAMKTVGGVITGLQKQVDRRRATSWPCSPSRTSSVDGGHGVPQDDVRSRPQARRRRRGRDAGPRRRAGGPAQAHRHEFEVFEAIDRRRRPPVRVRLPLSALHQRVIDDLKPSSPSTRASRRCSSTSTTSR